MGTKQGKGRPARFTSAEEMQKAVDAYFTDCAGRMMEDQDGRLVMDKNGRPILIDFHPPTITGLALALGFSTRKSLLDYQRKPMFCDVVTIAKSRVEQYAEESLFDRESLSGAKFSLLCNFGWAQDHSNESLPVRTARVVIVNT